MTAKAVPKYSGELAKPLPEPTIGEFLGKQPNEEVAKLVAQKLILLLQWYGIDKNTPNPWLILALRLARDHVPGFQRRTWKGSNKAGAPAKWKGSQAMELRADVAELVQQGNSEAKACRVLSQTKYKPARPASLLRRFKEIQKKHRKDGWSDERVLQWVKLTRDPAAMAAAVRSAYAEIISRNSA
jgi:hypothetical protein